MTSSAESQDPTWSQLPSDLEDPTDAPAVTPGAGAAVDPLAQALTRRRIRAQLFGEGEALVIADRFEVEEKLGSGGMSSVWRARDRQLGRSVALKFMRPEHSKGPVSRRLLREAHALAQLAHPNVVPVYDFGTHEDRVWVAMEHVPGRTLRPTRDDSEREPIALAHWLALGRGLAAVHAAGLVHRDIKPENALLGDDGRVRLIDFGLVRLADDDGAADETMKLDRRALGSLRSGPPPDSNSGSSAGASPSSGSGSPTAHSGTSLQLHGSLTVPDRALGTPAYMAPEQLRAERGTQRSDQYALCLCIVECLGGVRPFRKGKTSERLQAMAKGDYQPLPRSVPRRAREALARGLAFEPAARWPSVSELLDEIEAAYRTRRNRVAAGVVASLLGVTGLSAGALASQADGPDLRCAPDPNAFAGSLDASRFAEIEEAFARSELPYAPRTAGVARERFEAFKSGWSSERQAACREAQVFDREPDALYVKRLACFDEVKQEADAIARLMADGGTNLVAAAPALLEDLPDPRRCNGSLSVLPDPLTSNESEALRLVTEGRARLIANEREAAQASLDQANAILTGEAPNSRIRLSTRALEAELDVQEGDLDAGFLAMREAADAAARQPWPQYEADLRVRLAWEAAGQWGRPDAEAWLVSDAELALARVADESDPRWVRLTRARGLLEYAAGNYTESESLFREAIDRAREVELGIGNGDIRLDLANSMRKRQAFDEARTLYAELIEERTQLWGPQHPYVAHVEYNLAVLEVDAGRFAEAVPLARRASKSLRASEGDASVTALRADMLLVNIAITTGKLEEGAAALDELLPRFEAGLGPKHLETGHAHNARGALHFYAGDLEASVASYDRALVAFRAAGGETHDLVGMTLCNKGESLAALERPEEATRAFTRGLSILESRLGPDHPDLGVALKGRGVLHHQLGRLGLARDDLERAQALLVASADKPFELAETQVALARVLRDAGAVEDARALAEKALGEFMKVKQVDRAAALRTEFSLPG